MDKVKIYCVNLDEYIEVRIGMTLLEIAQTIEYRLGIRPLNAQVNNFTRDLLWKVYEPCDIHFADISHETGMRTYVRSLSFVMSKAVHDVLPGSKLYIEHSLSKGYYCMIRNGKPISPEQVQQVKNRMKEIIAADRSFVMRYERSEKVVELFRQLGSDDKADLIETSGLPYSRYYELDGYHDFYYGSLVPSTGYISLFDLEPCFDGVLLRVPQRKNPSELEPMVPQEMMRGVFAAHERLLDMLRVKWVGSLNKVIDRGEVDDMVLVSEAMQEKHIANIAEQIAQRYDDGVRVVLISGPSSSGKTTFCKRLQTQLITNFIRPYGLSLDDYFVERTETPRDEHGEYDFESLHALDLDFFNEQLSDIIAGKEVDLPTFDFTTGTRMYKGNKMKLDQGDILVIEGIHALNPELIPSIPAHATFKVYVSALTAIGLDAHNRIPSADNRLLRRLVRDFRYRGYSALDTLRRWPSVRRGEEKWGFPFQENADAMFNSAMLYELAVLRPFAEPILQMVPRSEPEYSEARRLLRFLAYFRQVPEHLLPNNSLMREFLGGSTFKY